MQKKSLSGAWKELDLEYNLMYSLLELWGKS